MPIRAVVFDLFDTLVDLRAEDLTFLEFQGRRLPASLADLHTALAGHVDVPLEGFLGAVLEVEAHYRESIVEGNRELPTHERFTAVLGRLGHEDAQLAERLTRMHMEGIRTHVHVPAHHGEVLRDLAARVRLGVCSNFSHTPTAERILAESRLAASFQAIVISETIGLRKPAGEIFAAVLASLGVAPEEALHVGDSLRADVAGAAAHGMRTAWLTRRVRDPERRLGEHAGPRPEWVVSDLSELAALLEAA